MDQEFVRIRIMQFPVQHLVDCVELRMRRERGEVRKRDLDDRKQIGVVPVRLLLSVPSGHIVERPVRPVLLAPHLDFHVDVAGIAEDKQKIKNDLLIVDMPPVGYERRIERNRIESCGV